MMAWDPISSLFKGPHDGFKKRESRIPAPDPSQAALEMWGKRTMKEREKGGALQLRCWR